MVVGDSELLRLRSFLALCGCLLGNSISSGTHLLDGGSIVIRTLTSDILTQLIRIVQLLLSEVLGKETCLEISFGVVVESIGESLVQGVHLRHNRLCHIHKGHNGTCRFWGNVLNLANSLDGIA